MTSFPPKIALGFGSVGSLALKEGVVFVAVGSGEEPELKDVESPDCGAV